MTRRGVSGILGRAGFLTALLIVFSFGAAASCLPESASCRDHCSQTVTSCKHECAVQSPQGSDANDPSHQKWADCGFACDEDFKQCRSSCPGQ